MHTGHDQWAMTQAHQINRCTGDCRTHAAVYRLHVTAPMPAARGHGLLYCPSVLPKSYKENTQVPCRAYHQTEKKSYRACREVEVCFHTHAVQDGESGCAWCCNMRARPGSKCSTLCNLNVTVRHLFIAHTAWAAWYSG
jgi:hypothetical protein